MTIVVDASVAVPWYIPTPRTPEALTILAANEPRIAPNLVLDELANAAWKLARSGQIDDDTAVGALAAMLSAFTRIVESAQLSEPAYQIARALDHPVYDCLYLALADAAGASVATFDRRLVRRLRGTRWWDRLHPLSKSIAV